MLPKSSMSPPTEKQRPAPESTTTRTRSSAPTAATASGSSSAKKLRGIALSLSGRSSVNHAVAPRISVVSMAATIRGHGAVVNQPLVWYGSPDLHPRNVRSPPVSTVALPAPPPAPTVLGDVLPGARARDALLVLAGAGLTTLGAQVSIAIPGSPVPVTGQTLGVVLA